MEPYKLKVYVASDHAGFEIKTKVTKYLSTKYKEANSIHDLGPLDDKRVDYPDFSNKVCTALKNSTGDSTTDLGILICGSGQGMAMRANKYKHIKAALCWSEEIAKLSREHNNANILCLGARLTEESLLFKIIDAFLSTSFEGGRHQNRVDKISAPIL